MILMGIVSLGFGQLPWFSFADAAPIGAQVASLSVLILSAGAFLLVGNQIRDLRWLQALVWVFLALGALYILGRAIPLFGFLTNQIFVRGLDGSLFWIWITVLAFSQAIFNHKLPPHWRVALLGMVMAAFYVAFVQTYHWKSGWVPVLIGIAAIFVAYSWRLGVIFSPFAAIAAVFLSERLIESDAYSYSTRIDAWILMGQAISESPILGLGWANYRWFMPLFPIRGYAVHFNSHNQYIDIVAQAGIVGLICFLWFFAVVGLVGWRLRTRTPEGFPRAYVYGALGGLTATLAAGMLGDWILPYFYNVGLTGFRSSVLAWIFLGGLVTLAQIYDTKSESRRSS
jgi:O-antigen ligase